MQKRTGKVNRNYGKPAREINAMVITRVILLISWIILALSWFGILRMNKGVLKTSLFEALEVSAPWISILLAVISMLFIGLWFRDKNFKLHNILLSLISIFLIVFIILSQLAWISQALPSPRGLEGVRL